MENFQKKKIYAGNNGFRNRGSEDSQQQDEPSWRKTLIDYGGVDTSGFEKKKFKKSDKVLERVRSLVNWMN